MNKEIKEILDKPKISILSYGNYISLDDYVKLKDCIIDLQKKLDFMIDRNDEKEERINKAIDELYYLESNCDITELGSIKLKQILKGDE